MKIMKKLTKKMEDMFKNDFAFTSGPLHNHTEASFDDGFQKVGDIVTVVHEMGGTNAAVTDHGNAIAWDPLDDYVISFNEKHDANIKPVFGIEAYVLQEFKEMLVEIAGEDVDFPEDATFNAHLCIYAKNNEGMRQIQKAMSRAKILDDGRAVLTNETLEMLRGGNVVVTSACIAGVFGSIILYNDRINKRIEKLEDEINGFADSLSIYEESKRQLEAATEKWSVAKAEVKEAKDASKKSFTAKVKSVETMKKKLDKAQAAFDKFLEDSSAKNEKSVKSALAQLEVIVEDSDMFQEGIEDATMKFNQRAAQIKSEMEATKALAATVDEKTAIMDAAKLEKDAFKAEVDAVAKDVAKVEAKEVKIKEWESRKLTKQQTTDIFNYRLAQMLDLFGEDFYMEVQNHGLEMEATIYKWLSNVAKNRKIPVVATNDAHVARNTQRDVDGRQIRRSCRWKKWDTVADDDVEYYLKNDRELAEALFQILPENVVIEAMSNVSKIFEKCNATIVTNSHAPKAKGIEDTKTELIRLARANIEKKYGDEWSEEHEKRFEYEIGIIDSMGFNDYFLITYDILNVARIIGGLSYEKLDELKGIMNNMTLDELLGYIEEFNTEVNQSVGLGRGSGAGSLVLRLLGITDVDPFKYDLLFEREKDCVH